ncbi:MAG TPA: hypothetical protein VLJ11_11820 [Bryobacteraceae bacterium]|nr:hypothetical protein [Bryobacteraceae bacterium]
MRFVFSRLAVLALTAAALLWPISLAAQSSDRDTLSIVLAQAALRQVSLSDPTKHWIVQIQFSSALSPENLPPDARFELFDLTEGRGVAVLPVASPHNSAVAQSPDLPHIFEITLAIDSLNSVHSYVLYGVGFLFRGQPVDDLHAMLQFLHPSATPSRSNPISFPAPIPTLQEGVAASKDDSDIYINGEADFVTEAPGSTRGNAIAEVKLSVPFFTNWRRELQVFAPQFSLDASTVQGHNPNSMSFGLTWDSFTPRPWLIVRKDFLVESTTNFQLSDSIFAPELRLPLPGNWLRPFAIVPFAGGEFGGNFNSPFRPSSGSPLARGIFGADLTAFFHLEKTRVGIKGIGFEAQWLRRVLGEPEIEVDSANPGDYSSAIFGRNPRDHAFAKVKFAFTDTFGFTVSYEQGQLPPSYQFVHNLVKVGLLYQAQVKARHQ